MHAKRRSLSGLYFSLCLSTVLLLSACQDTLVSPADDNPVLGTLTPNSATAEQTQVTGVRLKNIERSNDRPQLPENAIVSQSQESVQGDGGGVVAFATPCPITDPNWPDCDEGGGGDPDPDPDPLSLDYGSFIIPWTSSEVKTGSYTAASRDVSYLKVVSCSWVDGVQHTGCAMLDSYNDFSVQLNYWYEDVGAHHYHTEGAHEVHDSAIQTNGIDTDNTVADGVV